MQWKSVQKLWAYLTPIFLGSDLISTMEKHYNQFIKVDRQYRQCLLPLEVVIEQGRTLNYR